MKSKVPPSSEVPPYDPSRRPTIADVARASGVTKATVSMILNQRAHCFASAETRQRVLDAVDRLGYRPSPLARALSGMPTATVGFVIPGLDVEVTSRKLVGFESAARAQNLLTLIACTENDVDVEDRAVSWLMDHRVDAIAIYPSETGAHKQLRMLVDRGFPVVTYDGRGRIDFECDDVSVDSFAAGKLQALHLAEMGRRRLLHVGGRMRCYVTNQREAGFDAGLREAGVPPATKLLLTLDQLTHRHWNLGELEQLRDTLRNASSWDGMCTTGDVIGMAAIRIATELGIRVPDDMAIIGCDGLANSGEGAIPLSTISHDAEWAGREGFELLHQRLGGAKIEGGYRRLMVPPNLVARRSTTGKSAR